MKRASSCLLCVDCIMFRVPEVAYGPLVTGN